VKEEECTLNNTNCIVTAERAATSALREINVCETREETNKFKQFLLILESNFPLGK